MSRVKSLSGLSRLISGWRRSAQSRLKRNPVMKSPKWLHFKRQKAPTGQEESELVEDLRDPNSEGHPSPETSRTSTKPTERSTSIKRFSGIPALRLSLGENFRCDFAPDVDTSDEIEEISTGDAPEDANEGTRLKRTTSSRAWWRISGGDASVTSDATIEATNDATIDATNDATNDRLPEYLSVVHPQIEDSTITPKPRFGIPKKISKILSKL